MALAKTRLDRVANELGSKAPQVTLDERGIQRH